MFYQIALVFLEANHFFVPIFEERYAAERSIHIIVGGKTVRAMAERFGCDPKNIRAAIGPNIGPCCFETDADVPDALIAAVNGQNLEDVYMAYLGVE